jgi:hypothetical protein
VDITILNNEWKQRGKIDDCQKNKQQPVTQNAIQIFDFRDRRPSHSSALQKNESKGDYHRLKQLNVDVSQTHMSNYNIINGSVSKNTFYTSVGESGC